MTETLPEPAPSPAPRAEASEGAGASAGRAPEGELEVAAAILRALERGPLSAHDIAVALDANWPGLLDSRAGFLHPALLRLLCEGRVAASWADTTSGPRRVYFVTRAVARPEPGVAPAAPADADPRLVRAAQRAVRGLRFAPRLHAELRVEVLQHLVDLAAARRRRGDDPRAAAVGAVKDFGDPWRLGIDLRRTAQGRRTMMFPRNLRELLAGALIYDAGILLAIVAAIVFVRVRVITAYHIPTRSMEPTLHGDRRDGDRILVNRLVGAPDRFDIEVFDGWGSERKNYVKRCVGLPGEQIKLRHGDVYIDGRLVRKEGATLEALLFPLYSAQRTWKSATRDIPEEDVEERGNAFIEALQEFWENADGEWLVWRSGRFLGTPKDGGTAVLRIADPPEDDVLYEDPDDIDHGSYEVPDLRVTAVVEPASAESCVVVRLTRGSQDYDAVICGDGPGVAILLDGEELARDASVAVPTGERTRVRFSQVDRVLRLEIGDTLLRHDLPQPSFPTRHAKPGTVEFRIQGAPASVYPEMLERDVYYTPDSGYDDELQLGPDEFFMLGDNSGNSQDSRRNGAVHRSRLVGKPILVVWPPRRIHVPR